MVPSSEDHVIHPGEGDPWRLLEAGECHAGVVSEKERGPCSQLTGRPRTRFQSQTDWSRPPQDRV